MKKIRLLTLETDETTPQKIVFDDLDTLMGHIKSDTEKWYKANGKMCAGENIAFKIGETELTEKELLRLPDIEGNTE